MKCISITCNVSGEVWLHVCILSWLYTYFTFPDFPMRHKHTHTKGLVAKTASLSLAKVNALKDAAECGQQCGWNGERDASSVCLFHLKTAKRPRPSLKKAKRCRLRGNMRLERINIYGGTEEKANR